MTAVVEERAKKRYAKLHPTSASGSGQQSSNVNDVKSGSTLCTDAGTVALRRYSAGSRYPTPESMAMEISPSIDDQALGFFISNHVSLPALVPRGQYEWLLEALKAPTCDEVLRKSVSAACLAGLANSTKNPVIMFKAQDAYGSALRMTNSAIGVTETAIKDSTLMSVIMLGMYENFVFRDQQSLETWAKHVRGASSLLKLRGKEQFESDTARRIFHQFYGTILTVSLESGSAIPDGIRELYDYVNPTSDYDVQGRQWTIRLANFLHDSVALNQDNAGDPISMVTKAINLDRELNEIAALIPNIWQFETVHLDVPCKDVYGSFYHVYVDPWFAQMWNNLRLCRMHLCKIIRNHIHKGCSCSPPLFSPGEAEAQVGMAEQVIRATIGEVCASVPQLTGMTTFPKYPSPNGRKSPAGLRPKSAAPDHSRRQIHPPGTLLDPARPTSMHHLIWPLYAAGSSDLASDGMRQYAIDMLHFIALRIGTQQAVVLADGLKGMQVSGSARAQRTEMVLSTAIETPSSTYPREMQANYHELFQLSSRE